MNSSCIQVIPPFLPVLTRILAYTIKTQFEEIETSKEYSTITFYCSTKKGRILRFKLLIIRFGEFKLSSFYLSEDEDEKIFEESYKNIVDLTGQYTEEEFEGNIQILGFEKKFIYANHLKLLWLMRDAPCFFDYSRFVKKINIFEEDIPIEFINPKAKSGKGEPRFLEEVEKEEQPDEFIPLKVYLEVFSKEKIQKRKNIFSIFAQICVFLRNLHSIEITHSALNFDNILIKKNEDSQPIVTIINYLKRTQNGDEIDSHGKLGYLAPEIFTKKTISEKSDIWSLGCVFFEMIDECPMFKEKYRDKLEFRISNFSFDPLKFEKKFSLLEIGLLRLMLERSPVKRASAKELIRYLRKDMSVFDNDAKDKTERRESDGMEVNELDFNGEFLENVDYVNFKKFKIIKDLRDNLETLEDLKLLTSTASTGIEN